MEQQQEKANLNSKIEKVNEIGTWSGLKILNVKLEPGAEFQFIIKNEEEILNTYALILLDVDEKKDITINDDRESDYWEKKDANEGKRDLEL